MKIDNLTIHEGYNDLGTFELDITSIEIESKTSEEIKIVTPPISEELLFKFIFDPSENPVLPDYTVKLDLPPLDESTAVNGELIARGGKKTFSFTLSNIPVKTGSLTVTDGLETFTDNGDGTLRGSEGGSGTINYTTGAGSVTFFTPPVFGDNVVANYKKQISVSSEDLGTAGTATTYNFTLAHNNVVAGSLTISVGTVVLTDSGSGTLTGTGGSGTIDYTTGAVVINLITTVTGDFMAGYTYWGTATPETVGTGALTTSFSFNLVHHPIITGTLAITDGTENFTDNSDGTLTGSLGGSGTINYSTGAGTLSFTSSPAWGAEITADYTTGNVMLEEHTDSQGFVEITAPVYPVVTVKSTGDTFIDFDVVGTLDDRQDELYLMLDGGGTGPIYTLITDMFVRSGYLQVFDGDGTYYKIYPNIAIGTGITAVKINGKGDVFGYNNSTHQWTYIDTLTFHSIQHPEFLDIVSDGFYATNSSTGTDTSGHLGTTSTVFENFKGVVNNPEPYYISVGVSVFEPGAAMPVKMQDFAYLMPGDMDYHIVEVTADPYVAPDQTPSLDDIESITGVAFSTGFRDFLSGKNINTLDSARKAGPITYINGYPSTLSPDEVALLQSHVDLYSINQDATQNQILIAAGYGDLFKIANTARNAFLDDVVGTGMPLFRAAQIHEVATQNQKVVANLLADTLTNLKMANPADGVSGSTFASKALKTATNSCGCNDCQSGISPFAYLMDLLKYGATHIDYTGAPTSYLHPAGNTVNFATAMSDKYFQPFGDLNVSCDTLHQEFCRVRLVTEVLEKLIASLLPGGVSVIKQNALAAERKQYLTLVYRTILTQAGTSVEELRNVVLTNPQDAKIAAAQKLADKRGITLYDPASSELTADRMWLVFGGDINHDLTAANLEAVFGFRNSQRNVLTNTPQSLIEEWHELFLRNQWLSEDFPFTVYSREDVDPTDLSTFKTTWQPIVDPDTMGWEDMTLSNSDMSQFAKDLWINRKADADAFLEYCFSDTNTSELSADIRNRIVKVKELDITSHVIDNDTISLSPDNTNWFDFKIMTRKLNDINTDVFLKKSTLADTQPDLFQPYTPVPSSLSYPIVKYDRVLQTTVPVTYSTGGPSLVLTFATDAFLGQTGYVKLRHVLSGVTTEYDNVISPGITSVSFDSPSQGQISLTLNTNISWTSGEVYLIYTCEHRLISTRIIDPPKMISSLFSDLRTYTLLNPVTPLPAFITYLIWTYPSPSWPAFITATGDYGKLKQMFKMLSLNQNTDAIAEFLDTQLHTTRRDFNRFMNLFVSCDSYIDGIYTSPRPSQDDLYELASLFRKCARYQLRDTWVQEEIITQVDGNPAKLMLSSRYFWNSLSEPVSGRFDQGLYPSGVAILDPELVKESDLLDNPESQSARDIYTARKEALEGKLEDHMAMLNASPFDESAVDEILNEIATGSTGSSYVPLITPYTDLADLNNDLVSNDAFKVNDASEMLQSVFAISKEDFISIYSTKLLYELGDPGQFPTQAQLQTMAKLLVSGFKRSRLYPTFAIPSPGWLTVENNYNGLGDPLKYYQAIKMNFPVGRGIPELRSEWHNTLKAWNRVPAIQPDIVPPENIKDTASWTYATWSSRKVTLINNYSNTATDIITGGTAGTFFTKFKKHLDLILSRDTSFTMPGTPVFTPWFTQIRDFENQGEDIRPYIARLGFTSAEYRLLEKIYYLLDGTPSVNSNPVLDTECSDIIDIFLAVRARNLSFDLVLEEYDQPVIISQDFFQIYKPAPDAFPVTDLPVYNQWRSPHALRKAWLDTLQSRIDREKSVVDRWQNVLQEAEDRNMSLLRDAIIRALTPDCADWKKTADDLAKEYYIETKDNCCVKHTRVSFAIETLQGLYFALQTGNGDITGFNLYAPNIKTEWQWLGSYSTWRAAMFVFLYPENLLYPTLKRRQSPKFIELTQKISDANRFTPEDACSAGQEFEDYISDIEKLEIVCTTSADMLAYADDPGNCCETSVNNTVYTTFFFGQVPNNGRCYMSSKPYDDNNSDTHSFWEEIPVRAGAKLLCCYALGDRYYYDWGNVQNLALWAFYSYRDNGKLKLAYIKKELMKIGSDWSDEQETSEIQTVNGGNGWQVYASDIIACQHGEDWNDPSFIVTYDMGGYLRYYVAQYYKKDNLLSLIVNGDGNAVVDNSNDSDNTPNGSFVGNLVGGVKMIITDPNGNNPNNNIILYDLIVKVFQDGIIIEAGRVGSSNSVKLFAPGSNILGVFQSKEEDNKIIVAYRHLTYNFIVFQKYQIHVSIGAGNNVALSTTVSSPNPTINIGDVLFFLRNIYPINTQRRTPGGFAIKALSPVPLGLKISHPASPSSIVSSSPFSLTILNSVVLKVQSADCINDMNARAADIQTKYYYNLYAPSGTASIKDLIAEAYYFFPMFLALDQQKRGQYDSALAWYRSVYDYTNPLVDKRKIFYGLKLEESIVSTFNQMPNWLLDPLNPHLIAQTRANAYTRYTLLCIIQCLYSYADREFTLDTIETVPLASRLYQMALDLLKVKELESKTNQCQQKSLGCITGAVDLSAARTAGYGNHASRMMQDLNSLGDDEIIEGLVDDIAAILNVSTPLTYPDDFASVFALIEAARPADPAPQTVSDMGTAFGESVNNAGRYVFAMNDPAATNKFIGDSFALAVSDLSKVAVADLESSGSVGSLSWLNNSLPAYNANYTFGFANNSGHQNLPPSWMFSPKNPEITPYMANSNYSNALAILAQNPGVPASYYPLITFQFCTPDNPVYNMLELKGNVELYKIHNCRNIAGMVRELDAYSAATDSVTGIPVIGGNGDLSLPGINNYVPSQYRFKVLIERAKQLAQQAQQMESLFLAALEKEDAENYAQLRARQDLETARATVRLQDLRINQAQDEKTVADLQLDKFNFIQTHYDNLINSGLNGFEIASLFLLETAVGFETAAAIGFLKGGDFPMANGAAASALSTQSSILSQLASFQRRAEEWGFQKDLAGFDISIANQQIKVAEDNVRIVSQEREIAALGTDHAQASLDFLKNKFTSAEMYNWMGSVLERAYSYMLSLATGVAKAAESQLYFERQETAGPIILNDYWEIPSSGFTSGTADQKIDRRGLTGSARLMVDITKLEQHALDTAKRKLQMTKVISLAQNFPAEFQLFKETGVLNFELTNKLFDYDFPGHYLRLINDVKTTVIGLLPVYDQIKATLTADTVSYTVIGGNTFQRIPVKRLDLDSVALTSANSASGVFDMQPVQSDMLNPFEGMGIESRWEFKMPQFSNRCDFDNIADVLITVDYTALDNFVYRTQVLQDLDDTISFSRGFSFKNHFPDQWFELGEAEAGPDTFEVTVQLTRDFYPQGIQDLTLSGTPISLYFVREDDFEDEISDFDFRLANATGDTDKSTTDARFLFANLPQNNSPIMDLTLVFNNKTQVNRDLFSSGKIKDILLLVSCNAGLKSYPL
jgi:hypothetical protein